MRRRVEAMGAALAALLLTALATPTAGATTATIAGTTIADTATHPALRTTTSTAPKADPTGRPDKTGQGRVPERRPGLVTRSAARHGAGTSATHGTSGSTTADADSTGADTPLSLTIDELTPAAIPVHGAITVSGQVTNQDTATWTDILVYPFLSSEPLTSQAELAEAVATPGDAYVGDRIVDADHHATIASLAPGETATYSFSVPRSVLTEASLAKTGHGLLPGDYWFGVHALGAGPDGRDTEADGRARTFLPLVPQRATGSLPTAVVVPLRRSVAFEDDGSIADPEGWTQTLSGGGRLASLVDFGGAADADVTWLVDPGLVDAVRRLAAGNPPRSMAATIQPGQSDGEATATSTPTATPGTDPTDGTGGGAGDGTDAEGGTSDGASEGAGTTGGGTSTATAGIDGEPRPLTQAQLSRAEPAVRAAAEAAQAWLASLQTAVRPGEELLVLPYGDTDVSGAARHDPRLYRLARARATAAQVLPDLTGVRVAPAVGSPSGYLDPQALRLLDGDTTALVTDQMFTAAPATVVGAGDHDLVVTSSAAVAGGPGPDDPQAEVAMRQRLLAEAALRFLSDDPQPLVVQLPHDWQPTSGTDYFAGLELPWLDLTSVDDAVDPAAATPVDLADLQYPSSQARAALEAVNFQAASRLMASGAALQSLLTLNNAVGGTVADEALDTASYGARLHPDATRTRADRSRAWINDRLDRVRIAAPSAVTLSSSSGRFAATLVNGLGQPVTVSLDARTDAQLQIDGPRQVNLPPHSRTPLLLTARTQENGVHQVTLRVTDKRGVSLGGTTQLSIRSAQVSGVIWLFIGVGALLLFGTIALRLVRRFRASRRPDEPPTPAAASDPGSEAGDAGGTTPADPATARPAGPATAGRATAGPATAGPATAGPATPGPLPTSATGPAQRPVTTP